MLQKDFGGVGMKDGLTWLALQFWITNGGPHKLMIGMPGSFATWEGDSVTKQLDWVIKDGDVGVGIWDASLENPAWQTAAVWERLAKIQSVKPLGALRGTGPSLHSRAVGGFFDSAGRPSAESSPIPVFGKHR